MNKKGIQEKRADDPFHLRVIPCSFCSHDHRKAREDLENKGFNLTSINEDIVIAHRKYKHHDNIPIDVVIVMKEKMELVKV